MVRVRKKQSQGEDTGKKNARQRQNNVKNIGTRYGQDKDKARTRKGQDNDNDKTTTGQRQDNDNDKTKTKTRQRDDKDKTRTKQGQGTSHTAPAAARAAPNEPRRKQTASL